MERVQLVARLQQILGPDGVVHRPDELAIYEYDGAFDVHEPAVVVLPTRPEQVAEVVKLANEADVPVVPRGAGTGLSGGAVAKRGGIQVALTRMNRILELDYRNRRALVVASGAPSARMSASGTGWSGMRSASVPDSRRAGSTSVRPPGQKRAIRRCASGETAQTVAACAALATSSGSAFSAGRSFTA